VPFIIEILEECDNDDDFLIVLAGQVRALEKLIQKNEAHILLAPLEIIASMEDPAVRQKSIECLTDFLADKNLGAFLIQTSTLNIHCP
jgi:hypothetical protein